MRFSRLATSLATFLFVLPAASQDVLQIATFETIFSEVVEFPIFEIIADSAAPRRTEGVNLAAVVGGAAAVVAIIGVGL